MVDDVAAIDFSGPYVVSLCSAVWTVEYVDRARGHESCANAKCFLLLHSDALCAFAIYKCNLFNMAI